MRLLFGDYLMVLFLGIGCLSSFGVLSQQSQPEVVKLEETIRGNQEHPKVLTIVPWQAPSTKQALPSNIVDRINKKFVPLQRDELIRQIQGINQQ
jgi:hypothetical protein